MGPLAAGADRPATSMVPGGGGSLGVQISWGFQKLGFCFVWGTLNLGIILFLAKTRIIFATSHTAFQKLVVPEQLRKSFLDSSVNFEGALRRWRSVVLQRFCALQFSYQSLFALSSEIPSLKATQCYTSLLLDQILIISHNNVSSASGGPAVYFSSCQARETKPPAIVAPGALEKFCESV